MSGRLVIAATHSGVGKTTITAGLIAALVCKDLVVQPFKTGPDYIDGSYHTLAAGRPCRNLDAWMVPPDRVQALMAHAARDADLAVIEGVMGVYDGFGYDEEIGSTAHVAKLLQAPVVLVIDAARMARSAAAVALGYQQFDPGLPLAGFILNRVGSEHHGQGVAGAIERATGLPVLGWLPRAPALEIPERHLGLVPTAEPGRWRAFIDAAADAVVRHLDLDRLLAIARGAPSLAAGDLSALLPGAGATPVADRGGVIAVAADEAFSFTYPDNLDLLRAAGARIAFFSPLRDQGLPEDAGVVILSGGFPELYAGQLAINEPMKAALHRAHQQGVPIYAECGGLMYLTETVADMDGREHRMVGLLPGRSVMTRRLTMGYREARAAADSWLYSAGDRMRGHEFHYSTWEGRPADLPPAYELLPRTSDSSTDCSPSHMEGACLGSLWASYVHVHFGARPELVGRFIAAASARS
jgi:cobyrinic acid a,c-diamide synthase